jgi:two-component system, OmpR family, sensor histidine kinase KdpD
MGSKANSAMPEAQFVSRSFEKNSIRLAGRVLAALGLIAAITFVFFRVMPVNATTVGFIYLIAILMIATAGGLVESTLAAFAALLCLNFFFLPPIGTFTIADPRNWIALFTFLVTSLTTSQLSARAKRRTREVVERQHEIETLYALSRALLLADVSQSMGKQIVNQVARAFNFLAVALYDRRSGEIYRTAVDDLAEIDAKMRQATAQSISFEEEQTRLIITPIRLGGQPIGSLAIQGAFLSDAALQSLLNLVAISLERALAQENVNRAEVARRSEELKSTLLDAIAHEFKTPLTSIKAVTTELLSEPANQLLPQHRELIDIADEGVDRLALLVTQAIQLARIEGGEFRLNRGIHFPNSLVIGALRQMKTLTEGREINVSVADDLPLVRVDAELTQMVIAQLIDNALKYSFPNSPISIRAHVAGDKVIISVIDQGRGISEDEQGRIFEKFYRGKDEPNIKGTGMGLSIAREVIHAHGEEIWVASKPSQGSEFAFSLPIAPRSSAQ